MKNFRRWIHARECPPGAHERAESFFARESKIWLSQTTQPLLAVLGLLCHLVIFWLLCFPYTYFEEGMCEVNCTSITTGWQAMGWILIFPIFPYLTFFFSLLWKTVQIEKWLETSLKFNGLVNLGGFLLFACSLLSSIMRADLYNVAWYDAASGIHLSLILLAVVASSVISLVLRASLQRSRKLC